MQLIQSLTRWSNRLPGQLKKGSNQNDLLESFIDNEFNENVNKNKLNVDYTKFIEKNQKLLNIGQI
jgi:hypothetical protein